MNAEGPEERHSLWREPDWVRLWAGNAVTTLGSSMGAIAFPLIAFEVTGSIQTASSIAAAQAAAYLVGGPGAGWLVDRLNRGRLIVGADVFGLAVYGCFVAQLVRGAATAELLFAVAAATGLRQAIAGPAHAASVRTILGRARVASGAANQQAAQAAAQMAGPPVGGLAYSSGPAIPFIATATGFLLDLLLVLGIKHRLDIDTTTPQPQQTLSRSGIRSFCGEVGAGFTFLCGRSDTRLILLFVAAINLGLSMFYVSLNLRLVAGGVAPASIGVVDAAAGAGTLVGAVAATWVIAHLAVGRLLPVVAIMLAATWIPIAFAGNRANVIIPLVFAMMLAIPATNAALMGYVQAATPEDLQGRVASAGFVLSAAAPTLGPVLAGWTLTHLGPTIATLIPALAVLAATCALGTHERLRTLGRADSW